MAAAQSATETEYNACMREAKLKAQMLRDVGLKDKVPPLHPARPGARMRGHNYGGAGPQARRTRSG